MTLLSQSAEPILRRLSSGDRRTRSSGFPLGDLVRVASVVESTHHIRLSNYPGRVLQPYASSLTRLSHLNAIFIVGAGEFCSFSTTGLVKRAR
jgi:hypothetical protein